MVEINYSASGGLQACVSREARKRPARWIEQEMRDAIERELGVKNFNPVVQMGLIAAKAYHGYFVTGPEGHRVLDQQGSPIYEMPNLPLALAAASKVAPYVHATLAPVKVEEEDQDEAATKKINAAEKAQLLADRLGLSTTTQNTARSSSDHV